MFCLIVNVVSEFWGNAIDRRTKELQLKCFLMNATDLIFVYEVMRHSKDA